ncbi:MAG: SAM-dependent DNA methyltransferase, partial [Selenomonadaceae bacterium]|nr:SAM-dependent DNA methyltransferase [Selenomonadaceae bacterium]
MITGELKTKIDNIWNDMYSYGLANPLTVIEQLTYLFFIKSLDDLETKNEKDDELLGLKDGKRIFPQTPEGQAM